MGDGMDRGMRHPRGQAGVGHRDRGGTLATWRGRCQVPCGTVQAVAIAALLAWLPTAAAAFGVSAKLGELSRNVQSHATRDRMRALEEYARDARPSERALALYSLGMVHYADRDYDEAEGFLQEVGSDAGWVSEYAAYYRARGVALAEDFERAVPLLAAFATDHPDSRWRPASERLHVESLMRLRRLEAARQLVSRAASPLDEPVRLYLAARIEHAAGQVRSAIDLYRRAYYRFPFSDQAAASEQQLDRLRARMGRSYPSAPASWRLERAQRLYEGRHYSRASAEFTRALGAGLQGAEHDQAIVRRGAADYHRRRSSEAYSALARARPGDPDLEAERLYWLCALERRRGLVGPMRSSLAKLKARHAGSEWYQKALLIAGNYYYLRNDVPEYLRWFGLLVKAFPSGEHAPYAHWKRVWRGWLSRSPRVEDLLTEHVRQFPAAPTAASALYWLGRLHEMEGRQADADGHFLAVADAYPHYYHGGLATAKLDSRDPEAAGIARKIVGTLPGPRHLSAEAGGRASAVLETGEVLAGLGLESEARRVLGDLDFRESGAHLAALRLARLDASKGRHYLALRVMKRYVYGYLRMPIASLDREYWQYLYPLGWEDSLRSRAGRHRLSPYLVAALIRQESEFNPAARSSAGARGLMQVMPHLGRSLFRRLGISGFSSSRLTDPDISLRLGTFHLKEVLERAGGQAEFALAGYNAGESRVSRWKGLGPFRDVEEFVETIPFSETRGYVQAVLRNESMYRRLYGD